MASMLVVDDEGALRGAIRAVLERCGHSVMEAENGRKALLLCQSRSFDVVVADLLMPDCDGIELLMALRKVPSRPLIAVMTGAWAQGPFNQLEIARSLGAAVALQKPFTGRQFLAAIDPLFGAPGHEGKRGDTPTAPPDVHSCPCVELEDDRQGMRLR
jgi:CheY-like chemotaxis protein